MLEKTELDPRLEGALAGGARLVVEVDEDGYPPLAAAGAHALAVRVEGDVPAAPCDGEGARVDALAETAPLGPGVAVDGEHVGPGLRVPDRGDRRLAAAGEGRGGG